MKITSKRAAVILTRFNELTDLADQFTGHWNTRFDDDGNIEREINTSCHCHPEYEWRIEKTADEFMEWLDKRAAESTY